MTKLKNKSPFIFLDIDGVIATTDEPSSDQKFWFNERAYPFTKGCVKILNQILDKTNADIILSSDWRRAFDLEILDEIFEFNKVIKSPIDITPVLHDRELEIRKIVTTRRLSKFLVLDDMKLSIYNERFIRTNPKLGLQNEHVKKAVKLLK